MFRQAIQNQFRSHFNPHIVQSRANALLNPKCGVSRRTFSTSSATQASTQQLTDVKPPSSMPTTTGENGAGKLAEKGNSSTTTTATPASSTPHVEQSTRTYTMDELFNPNTPGKAGESDASQIPQIIRPMLDKNSTGTFHVTEFHSSPHGGTFSKEYHGKYSPDHGLTLNQKHITHSDPKLPPSLDPNVTMQTEASDAARREFLQKSAEKEQQALFEQMEEEAEDAFDHSFRAFSSSWPFSAPFAHHPRFFRREFFDNPRLLNALTNPAEKNALAAKGERNAITNGQQQLNAHQSGQQAATDAQHNVQQTLQPGQQVEQAHTAMTPHVNKQQPAYDELRNFDGFGPYEMMDSVGPVHPWFGPMMHPFGRRSPFTRFDSFFDDFANFPHFSPFQHFNRLKHFGADVPGYGHHAPMRHFDRHGMRGHGPELHQPHHLSPHSHHPAHPQHHPHHHPAHHPAQQPHARAAAPQATAQAQNAEQRMTNNTMNTNTPGATVAAENSALNNQASQTAGSSNTQTATAPTASNVTRAEQTAAQNVSADAMANANAPQQIFQDQSHHHLHPSSYYDPQRGFTPESFDHWIHDVREGMHDYQRQMRDMTRFAKRAEKAFRRGRHRRDPFDSFFNDFDPFGKGFGHGRFWI